MTRPPRIRLALAAVAGLAAGVFAWTRVAGLEPFLELKVTREAGSESYEVWDLLIEARGGETIEEVRAESASPGLHVVGTGSLREMQSGWRTVIRLQLDHGAKVPAIVRVSQTGRVPRTYDVAFGSAP